jgi:hypothetical protein
MFYQSGDDPQLLSDLRSALRRWHRSTLGNAPLALHLGDVERRRAANPQLTRSGALHETIRAGLAWLRDGDQGTHAELLELRYLQQQSMYRLQESYHLGERSLYYRLEEAFVALAHAVWFIEHGDTRASASSAAPAASQPAQWRTRHLPPPTYTTLFGVDEPLARLLDWLNDLDGHWLISLEGMGGLGKTALAREAASHLAETDRFADIVWLAIKPESYPLDGRQPLVHPALTCDRVLDDIARQLDGIDLDALSVAAKLDRVRAMLQAHPYLVVVDNLEAVSDCGDVLDLLWELVDPSKFLLTGRHRVEQEARALSIVTIHELAESESLAFMRHEGRLRGLPELTEASDDSLRSILSVTGGNPLAIKLVIGQAVSLPLSHVLAALQAAQAGADALYEYLYCASWDLLSAPARDLLLQVARLPDCGGTWEELSGNAGLSQEDLASAVEELTSHSLLEAAGLEEKTYTIHPLTHHFVVGQATQQAL